MIKLMIYLHLNLISAYFMSRTFSRRRSGKRNHSKNRHREKTPLRAGHRKESVHRRRYERKYSRRKGEYKYYSPSSSSSSSNSSSSSGSSSGDSSSASLSARQRRKTPHFRVIKGELLGEKYRVMRELGTGTFGKVVEGRFEGDLYAIKVIKPVHKYISSAKTERAIIKELCRRDSQNDHHLVRYYESFYHKNYFCLVFEPLGPSLYDVIKLNNYVGYPPYYVQSFARQLIEAVGFMHRHGYTHTDLKPENVLLCSEEFIEESQKMKIPRRSKIKLIDFGAATHQNESHSSMINTRQYRCPEVLVQCGSWNQSSDVWSIGCILVELATGNLLFPVHSDVDHIYMIDKLIGKFPQKLAQHCESSLAKYFNGDGSINYQNGDKDVRDWDIVNDLKPLSKQLRGYEGLEDLVRCCLIIDPKRRITCVEALKHPYFSLDLKEQRRGLPTSSENTK